MSWLVWVVCFAGLVCGAEVSWAQSEPQHRPATTQVVARFVMAEVWVDSGEKALAAWQVELKAVRGEVKIVGVEGGDHKDVYHDPPYYDPAALMGGRIVLASYTTAERPPKGKILVARLHLRISGECELEGRSIAAADTDAAAIGVGVKVTIQRTEAKE